MDMNDDGLKLTLVIDLMEDEVLCVHGSFTFLYARLIYVRETKSSVYDLFDENNHAHETLLLKGVRLACKRDCNYQILHTCSQDSTD